jgi:hypothetical protein
VYEPGQLLHLSLPLTSRVRAVRDSRDPGRPHKSGPETHRFSLSVLCDRSHGTFLCRDHVAHDVAKYGDRFPTRFTESAERRRLLKSCAFLLCSFIEELA